MKTAPNTPVQPDWDSYVADAEDGPMFVSFDVAVAQEEDLTASLKTCLRVQIPIKKPQENGAPEEKEAARLWQMEDQLNEALAKAKVVCRFVARLTHGGVRELVFQLEDLKSFGNVLQAWQEGIKDYKIEYERHDGWEFFNDVVRPGPEEWIGICDRRVVDSLLESGSDPDKPHELHYQFAGEGDALRSVAEQLQSRGYAPVGEPDFDKGELAMAISLPLDLEQIIEQSITNDELALQAGARCDGWVAQPVT